MKCSGLTFLRLLSVLLAAFISAAFANEIKQDGFPRCPPWPAELELNSASLPSVQQALKHAPPILYALGKDRRLKLEQMLASGANPNVCAGGSSILTLSTVGGELEEVRLLLEHSAHPDLPLGDSGESPLFSALAFGRFDIAHLLLSKGANPRRTTDGGTTLLHHLAIAPIGDERTAQLQQMIAEELVAAGAPINAQNVVGSTPLMVAVAARNQRLVLFLLKKGANPEIQNKRGATARTLARQLNNPDLIAIFGEKQ